MRCAPLNKNCSLVIGFAILRTSLRTSEVRTLGAFFVIVLSIARYSFLDIGLATAYSFQNHAKYQCSPVCVHQTVPS